MTQTLRHIIRKGMALGRDQRGAAIIEFSIVAPVLLVMAWGLAEFGRAMHQQHKVTKAVQDAARYLARVPIDTSGCTGSPPTATVADSADLTRAQNLALRGSIDATQPYLLPAWKDPSTTLTITFTCFDNTGGTYYGPDWLAVVEVDAAVPYADLGMLDALNLGPLTIHASHQEMSIGE